MPIKNTAKKKSVAQKKAPAKQPIKAKSAAQPMAKVATAPRAVKKDVMSPLVMVKLWFEGWKKTFVLRGRSSRFELWNFLFLNSILAIIIQLKCSYILSARFLRDATAAGYGLSEIDTYINYATVGFYAVVFLPLFPLGSMLVRRMHDIGRVAWDKCLKPVFMSMVSMSVLFYTIELMADTDYLNTIVLLQVCFVTVIYGLLFYSFKFLIMSLFYPGDKGRNAYGDEAYNTGEHEEWALDLCCLWILFILTISILLLVMAII